MADENRFTPLRILHRLVKFADPWLSVAKEFAPAGLWPLVGSVFTAVFAMIANAIAKINEYGWDGWILALACTSLMSMIAFACIRVSFPSQPINDAKKMDEIEKFEAEVNRLNAAVTIFKSALEESHGILLDTKRDLENCKKTAEGCRASIRAIADKDEMKMRTDEIHKLAELLRKKGEEEFSSILWADWMRKEGDFRRHLKRWCRETALYGADYEKVMYVTENEMLGDWSFEDHWFPSSDYIYRYKSFSIVYNNFIEEEDAVGVNLRKITYGI